MAKTQKVGTCLWFDAQAEEAAKFYTSLFPGSKITAVSHYTKDMPMPEGTVLTVVFDLAGTEFMALNGGPIFKFSEASSMIVQCDGQVEIDRLWSALLANGGKEQQCGWLKDRYGLPWQIVPARLREIMKDPDQGRIARVMGVIMKMVKLDAAKIEAAYAGS